MMYVYIICMYILYTYVYTYSINVMLMTPDKRTRHTHMINVASVRKGKMKIILMPTMAKLLCFFCGMICGHCYCAGAKPKWYLSIYNKKYMYLGTSLSLDINSWSVICKCRSHLFVMSNHESSGSWIAVTLAAWTKCGWPWWIFVETLTIFDHIISVEFGTSEWHNIDSSQRFDSVSCRWKGWMAGVFSTLRFFATQGWTQSPSSRGV